MKKLLALTFPIFAFLTLGCQSESAEDSSSASKASVIPVAVESNSESRSETVSNNGVFSDALWNDGQAEIAFYQVERSRNQYGQEAPQEFLAGTYIVKHDYDIDLESKARADSKNSVPAFKAALFFEFESGAYQYKRNWVTNFAMADMAPLKTSYTNFDWCSNQYKEFSFKGDKNGNNQARYLMRSDDYFNEDVNYDVDAATYPADEIRLLVRSFDFSEKARQDFGVLQDNGEIIRAQASLSGKETVSTKAGEMETEIITIKYEKPISSAIGNKSDLVENYWVSTRPDRILVQMAAESGSYKMTLVEDLRSAYWKENFYPALKRVTARP